MLVGEAGAQLRVRLGDGNELADAAGGQSFQVRPDMVVRQSEHANSQHHRSPPPIRGLKSVGQNTHVYSLRVATPHRGTPAPESPGGRVATAYCRRGLPATC